MTLFKHLTILAIVSCLLSPVVHAEDQLEYWYQLDIVVFKPKNSDLDEESWPDEAFSFPHNMVSVTAPEFSRLSQLEQLDEAPTETQPQTENSTLGQNEFVFASESRGSRNQRVVATITGSLNETLDGTLNERIARAAAEDVRSTFANSEHSASQKDTDTVDSSLENADANAGQSAATISSEGDNSRIDHSQVNSSQVNIAEILARVDPLSLGTKAFNNDIEASSLTSIARSLSRSSRFDVLAHQSWLQPINGDATPIMIQTGARYDDRFEVEGTISFSRSRFLHVHTNLQLTKFEPRGGAVNPYVAGFSSSLSNDTLQAYPELVKVEQERGQYYAARHHLMQQSRRMRSNELHYLDHPMLGILVRINRHTIEVAGED